MYEQHTCPECGHTGDDFDEATMDGDVPVIVCPNCDWYGPIEE